MAPAASAAPEEPQPIGGTGVLAAGAMGAVVALALGLYGRAHEPQSDLAITLGFADTITMKVWLTTIAVLFALFQICAGALPGLLSAMMPHVAPTPGQLGTVSGMCSQAVNIGNLVGPPAILAVYAAAGTAAAVAVLIVVLAASLVAIGGLPVFRKNLGQAA